MSAVLLLTDSTNYRTQLLVASPYLNKLTLWTPYKPRQKKKKNKHRSLNSCSIKTFENCKRIKSAVGGEEENKASVFNVPLRAQCQSNGWVAQHCSWFHFHVLMLRKQVFLLHYVFNTVRILESQQISALLNLND